MAKSAPSRSKKAAAFSTAKAPALDQSDYIAEAAREHHAADLLARRERHRQRKRLSLENDCRDFHLGPQHFYSRHPKHDPGNDQDHASKAPPAYWEWKAARVIATCKKIEVGGWREMLLTLPPGEPMKARAIEVFRCGFAGDAKGIIQLMKEVMAVPKLDEELFLWLHIKLCHELLAIEQEQHEPASKAPPIEQPAIIIKKKHLLKNDMLVLRLIHNRKPTLVRQVDITGDPTGPGRNTVLAAIRKLTGLGYIYQPDGPRQGYTTTDAGAEIALAAK